jgi:hypothetical protein
MFKQFSLAALKLARKELENVSVSQVETLIRAGMPLLKEILDAEIASQEQQATAKVASLKK